MEHMDYVFARHIRTKDFVLVSVRSKSYGESKMLRYYIRSGKIEDAHNPRNEVFDPDLKQGVKDFLACPDCAEILTPEGLCIDCDY